MKVNESIGVEIIELTELCVKEAYEKKTTDLKMKIEECSRKIDEKQRDIDRLNIKFESGKTILEELEKIRIISMRTKIIKRDWKF